MDRRTCLDRNRQSRFCPGQELREKSCSEEEEKKRRAETGRGLRSASVTATRSSAPGEHPNGPSGRAEQAENDAALKALRARLLAPPPLPPAAQSPARGAAKALLLVRLPTGGDDLSQLMGMLSNVSRVWWGHYRVQARIMAASDSSGDESLGPIQYRMQNRQVFALPDQGVPRRRRQRHYPEFRLQDCTLVRVGGQPAPTLTATAPATEAAKPAAGAATPVAPARPARNAIEPDSPLGRGVRLHGEKDFQPALQQLLIAAQSLLHHGSRSISLTRMAGSAWMLKRRRQRSARSDWIRAPSRSCGNPIPQRRGGRSAAPRRASTPGFISPSGSTAAFSASSRPASPAPGCRSSGRCAQAGSRPHRSRRGREFVHAASSAPSQPGSACPVEPRQEAGSAVALCSGSHRSGRCRPPRR